MITIEILAVKQFRDRDYAIFYTDEHGMPSIEYRLNKNHEQHAINGFVKDKREKLMATYGGGEIWIHDERKATHPVVELYVGGTRVYEGEA